MCVVARLGLQLELRYQDLDLDLDLDLGATGTKGEVIHGTTRG